MSGPGDVVLTLLDQLVDRVLTGQPERTDGKPVNPHIVYSHLVQGRPIDARDYANPWSPMGGSTLQDEAEKKAATTPSDGSTPADEKKKATSQAKFQKAIQATYHTSELVDRMLMVTNDGTYQEYQGDGRRLSFAYEGIINAMQPVPAPPMAEDVKERLDKAKAVLYILDDEGEIEDRTRGYTRYLKNAKAYAQAKADFALQQAMVLSDPNKADLWPMIAAPLQQTVDDAWDALKSQGAEKIEAALDTVESIGVNLGARMVARARESYDAWKLNLAGLPVQTPYSYIEPSRWYDHEETDIGFTRLEVAQAQASTHVAGSSSSFARTFAENHSQSTQGGGTVQIAMFGVAGGGSGGTSTSDTGGASGGSSKFEFHNTAKDLRVELEWGLCEIVRPWCMSDLFFMQNWYLTGQRKHAVSDGSLEAQVGKDQQLLPMIPHQFLVVRNVKISSTDWGADGTTLSQVNQEHKEHTDTDTGSVSGGVAFSVGFFTVGGGAEHSWSDSKSDTSGSSSASDDNQQSWHFDGTTLSIDGSQIVGWVSRILPASPLLDDPGLDDAGAEPADEPAAEPVAESGEPVPAGAAQS